MELRLLVARTLEQLQEVKAQALSFVRYAMCDVLWRCAMCDMRCCMLYGIPLGYESVRRHRKTPYFADFTVFLVYRIFLRVRLPSPSLFFI